MARYISSDARQHSINQSNERSESSLSSPIEMDDLYHEQVPNSPVYSPVPPPYVTEVEEGEAVETNADTFSPYRNLPQSCQKEDLKRYCLASWIRCRFYLVHAKREASKRKCQYCLALSSIFFIVVVSALVFTVANRASAIFLSQAEQDSGEIDLKMTPLHTHALNYTQYMHVHGDDNGQYATWRSSFTTQVFSPQCISLARTQGYYTSVGGDLGWTHRTPSCEADCLSLICNEPTTKTASTLVMVDSAREAHMQFGRNWSRAPLKRGEVALSATIANELNLRVGDVVILSVDIKRIIKTSLQYAGMYISEMESANKWDGKGGYSDKYDALFKSLYETTYTAHGTTPAINIYKVRMRLLFSTIPHAAVSTFTSSHPLSNVAVRVKYVVSDWEGRMGSDMGNRIVMMEYGREREDEGVKGEVKDRGDGYKKTSVAEMYSWMQSNIHYPPVLDYNNTYPASFSSSPLLTNTYSSQPQLKMLQKEDNTNSSFNVDINGLKLKVSNPRVAEAFRALHSPTQNTHLTTDISTESFDSLNPPDSEPLFDTSLITNEYDHHSLTNSNSLSPLDTTSPPPDYFADLLLNLHPLYLHRNMTIILAVTTVPPPPPTPPPPLPELTYPLLPLPLIAYILRGYHYLPLHQSASNLFVNLPPTRTDTYINTNYDSIADTVIAFFNKILVEAGFDSVDTELVVLDALEAQKMVSLFLGLIMSVILTILSLLSLMLIYSLLMISVETRTFEVAVNRMVGQDKQSVVFMIIVQALSYAIPAYIIGMIIAQIAGVIVINIIGDAVGVSLDTSIDTAGIIVATLLGILLPLIASILPILHALNINITSALRPAAQNKNVEVTIERTNMRIDPPLLLLGVGMGALGFSIFYLLPLSLISMDLTLFFNIFFVLLLLLLFGLLLLSLNIQRIVESVLVFICLFWEKSAITLMIGKNLTQHAAKNRKTMLMYALSMGFVVFITVSYNIELTLLQMTDVRKKGSNVVVEREGDLGGITAFQVADIENILSSGLGTNPSRYKTYHQLAHEINNLRSTQPFTPFDALPLTDPPTPAPDTSDFETNSSIWSTLAESQFEEQAVGVGAAKSKTCNIKWGWMACDLSPSLEASQTRSTSLFFLNEHTQNTCGLSSKMVDSVYQKYIVLESGRSSFKHTDMSLSSSLYTVRGGQSMIMDTSLFEWTGFSGLNDTLRLNYLIADHSSSPPPVIDEDDDVPATTNTMVAHTLKPGVVLSSLPGTRVTAKKKFSALHVFVSLPTYVHLSGPAYDSARDVVFEKLFISTENDRCTNLVGNAILNYQRAGAGAYSGAGVGASLSIWKDTSSGDDGLITTLALVFNIITVLTLCLCLFSLISTTYCNIINSSPDIAILRSLGFTKFELVRLYIYETFLLVISSSLIGIIIGFITSYSLLLQQLLMVQLPLFFVFPTDTVVIVLIAAAISALIAVFTPLRFILQKSIASTFKIFL